MNLTNLFKGRALGLLTVLLTTSSRGADSPATHNMLIVGKETVFLSHLPMFQDEGTEPMPHRYQAIFEVAFKPAGMDQRASLAKDREKHPATKVYTLGPTQNFPLPSLKTGKISSFPATVFRGHLEKLQNKKAFQSNRDNGEGPIFDAEVTVKRVVHFRQFDPKAKKPADLEYLLFGRGQELFLAHRIVSAPDFDQILAVRIQDHRFSDDELATGVPVKISKTADSATTRLKEKQEAAGEIFGGAPASATIHFEVVKELYFENGELQLPPVFRRTPLEKLAGFP